MDYFDIISSQRGGICCSKEFVKGFGEQLNDLIVSPLKVKEKFDSAVGSFTDTANYTDIIPECTNLSVGYFNQHSAQERQDGWWLEEILVPALLKVDWEELPTHRKPVELDNKWSYGKQWSQKDDNQSITKVFQVEYFGM